MVHLNVHIYLNNNTMSENMIIYMPDFLYSYTSSNLGSRLYRWLYQKFTNTFYNPFILLIK